MGEAAFLQTLLDVAQQLRAGAGAPGAWGGRQEGAPRIQREGRLAAGHGGGGPGDGDAAVGSDEREHVAAEPGLQPHHGLTGEHLKGPGVATLGWPGCAGPAHGFGAAAGVPSAWVNVCCQRESVRRLTPKASPVAAGPSRVKNCSMVSRCGASLGVISQQGPNCASR